MDFAPLLNVTRTEAIRKIQAVREIPPMVKVGIVAGLAMVTDRDYARYLALLMDATVALSESARGRMVLDEIGIKYSQPEPVAAGSD